MQETKHTSASPSAGSKRSISFTAAAFEDILHCAYDTCDRRKRSAMTASSSTSSEASTTETFVQSVGLASFDPLKASTPTFLKMSHSNSQTWVNPLVAEKDKFETVVTNLSRLFVFSREQSPFCPETLDAWLEHRAALARAKATLAARQLAAKDCYLRVSRSAIPPLQRPLGGRVLSDNLTTVTAERTMWCKRWERHSEHQEPWPNIPEIYEAPWPTIAEMKYEGEDRAESHVARFLPLPRFRANETVPAKDCISTLDYWAPFDQINKVPTEDDVLSRLFGVDEVLEDDIPHLLNADLLAAIDTTEIF